MKTTFKRIFSSVTVLTLCLLANLGISSDSMQLPLNIQKKTVNSTQDMQNFILYPADALINQAENTDKLSYHYSHRSHYSHSSHHSHYSSRF